MGYKDCFIRNPFAEQKGPSEIPSTEIQVPNPVPSPDTVRPLPQRPAEKPVGPLEAPDGTKKIPKPIKQNP